MIVSDKYKFIFIKTKKTAGSSLETYLSGLCDDNDILTPVMPKVEGHKAANFKGSIKTLNPIIKNNRGINKIIYLRKYLNGNVFYNHMPATQIKELVGKYRWNNYFKFCVERNPWDKVVSHYHHQKSAGFSEGYVPEENFEKYVKNAAVTVYNYPIYTDVSSDFILVDKVLKYENLNSDLKNVFNNLGVPFDGELGVRAKSNYRKKRIPYQKYYNNKTRKLVEDIFKKEINFMDYSFQ